MIKAKYLGYKNDLLDNGRVYKISTHCQGSHLVVSVRNTKIQYENLERFLKEWKVEVVGHGK